MAVQGGLLATMVAQREEEKKLEHDDSKRGAVRPILSFLISKLVAYSILGLLLGWFGSLFELSLTARTIMQIAVVIFMIGTALALLEVHPIFRYFIIQPPKFLTRLVRKQSKSRDTFAPALLGAFTIFIPCGTTQAMMALAIASGSAVKGAGIMYAFVLGTVPVFFALGYFATKLGDRWQKKFFKVAAYAIIILAVFNLNNAIALTGSKWTIGGTVKAAFCTIAYCENGGQEVVANAQVNNEATITIGSYGYTPKQINVKAGSEVKLTLINRDGDSCAQAFTIPKLKIQKIIRPGQTETVTFKAPSEPTQIAFMCSMGMYRGTINVN